MQTDTNYIAKLHIPKPAELHPGDREKVAHFLREQADAIMQNGPEMGDDYEVTMTDSGDGYVVSGVTSEGNGLDGITVTEQKDG